MFVLGVCILPDNMAFIPINELRSNSIPSKYKYDTIKASDWLMPSNTGIEWPRDEVRIFNFQCDMEARSHIGRSEEKLVIE